MGSACRCLLQPGLAYSLSTADFRVHSISSSFFYINSGTSEPESDRIYIPPPSTEPQRPIKMYRNESAHFCPAHLTLEPDLFFRPIPTAIFEVYCGFCVLVGQVFSPKVVLITSCVCYSWEAYQDPPGLPHFRDSGAAVGAVWFKLLQTFSIFVISRLQFHATRQLHMN